MTLLVVVEPPLKYHPDAYRLSSNSDSRESGQRTVLSWAV